MPADSNYGSSALARISLIYCYLGCPHQNGNVLRVHGVFWTSQVHRIWYQEHKEEDQKDELIPEQDGYWGRGLFGNNWERYGLSEKGIFPFYLPNQTGTNMDARRLGNKIWKDGTECGEIGSCSIHGFFFLPWRDNKLIQVLIGSLFFGLSI